MGTVGRTCVVPDDLEKSIISSHLIKISLDLRAAWPAYISWVLNFCPLVLAQIKAKCHGAIMAGFNSGLLKELRVPLPPIAEQRRIAEVLARAEALRAKRRAALAQLDPLTQTLFLDLFGDPASNPKGFPAGSIEVVVKDPRKDVRCGPFGTQLKVHELVETGIPLLGIENVLDEGFQPRTTKFLTERKAKELGAFDVEPGDVLVTRMGTIGRSCVVPATFSGGRFSYHLFRVRPDHSRCLPEFLAATISKSGIFQAQLAAHAHGAIMAGLNTGDLKAVRFLVPPLKLQHEFVARVTSVAKVKAAYQASLSELDVLFASLQHRAFRGEL